MNCEQAQEIILTDDLDGCLKEPLKAKLDGHLEKCADCRAFVAIARKMLREPFEDLPREKMPDSVASAIMQHVREKEYEGEKAWIDAVLEKIRIWHAPLLPAAGWAMTVVICCLIAGAGLRMNGSEQAKQAQRVLFLAEVAGWSPAESKAAGEYGTSVETYFLEDKEAS